jgi:beta-barrel assembly-enhancing protease
MAGIVRYLLAACCVPAVLSCSAITDMFLSDEDELNIGAKLAAQIAADSAVYRPYSDTSPDRHEVIQYITAMGRKIAAAQTDRKGFPFAFTILEDTAVNAFAVPGGHVYVYTGLLRAAQSGAEVAGVLAHEVGHITMRHGANRLVQSYGISFLNQIIFGGDTASVGTAVAKMLEGLVFLKFSRDDEYQADSCAVSYTVASRYNPYGLKNFFLALMARYGNQSLGPFEVFSTHPGTVDRIARIQALIAEVPGAPADDNSTWIYQNEYAAIKTKL